MLTFFPGIGQHEDLAGVVNSLPGELVYLKTVFIVEVAQARAAPEDCVVGQSVCHEGYKFLDPREMLIKIEQIDEIWEFFL